MDGLAAVNPTTVGTKKAVNPTTVGTKKAVNPTTVGTKKGMGRDDDSLSHPIFMTSVRRTICKITKSKI